MSESSASAPNDAPARWLQQCLGCLLPEAEEPDGDQRQQRPPPNAAPPGAAAQAAAYPPTASMVASPPATERPGPTAQADHGAGRPVATERLPDAALSAVHPDSLSELLPRIDQWRAEGGPEQDRAREARGERRDIAADRIRRWLRLGNPNAPINLNGLSLTGVPPLPPSAKRLDLTRNNLSHLPAGLPDGLEELSLAQNSLASLPETLPASLRLLDVGFNRLERLPALPPGLTTLSASANQLRELPDLPASLTTLMVSRNELSRLPVLPAGLTGLNAGSNRIEALPAPLPASLSTLYVADNWIEVLPDFPATLRLLSVDQNRLLWLPELPDRLETLNATSNRLSSLPALPDRLRALEVGSNEITRLPDPLPASLDALNVDHNRLAHLPALPDGLRGLNASHNQITELPEALPDSLFDLQVASNLLTALPGHLPPLLPEVDVSENQITALPRTLLAGDCGIVLRGNPLPDAEVASLRALFAAPDYNGPDVVLPPVGSALQASVTAWLDAESAQSWAAFEDQEGAPEFNRFLMALRHTVNFANDPTSFRRHVGAFLEQVGQRDTLREKCFQVAFDATETCEDRVTLTWNNMQIARHMDDAENGLYDRNLPELVSLARGMFRLDALEQIAKEKVEALLRLDRYRANPGRLDPLEVHLAYPVMLGNELDLPLHAPGMKFDNLVDAYNDDLGTPGYRQEAAQRVRAEEARGFSRYFATWGPWEAVMARVAPEAYHTAKDELVEAMGDRFQARLEAENLVGNADAERTIGAQVRAEITHEIMDQLTRSVLQDQDLASLLDPAAGAAR